MTGETTTIEFDLDKEQELRELTSEIRKKKIRIGKDEFLLKVFITQHAPFLYLYMTQTGSDFFSKKSEIFFYNRARNYTRETNPKQMEDYNTKSEELPVTYRGVIYPWYCDQMGHMNVMWYSGKFDEATWHLFNIFGCTPSYMTQNNRGMVAVEQHLVYKKELLAGDLIHIRSGIIEVKEKSIRFLHEMINTETNELAATCILIGVHLDTVSRKATPFPAHIVTNAREMILLPKIS